MSVLVGPDADTFVHEERDFFAETKVETKLL